MALITSKGRVYEGPVAEAINKLFDEYFTAILDGPHDAKEELMIIESLQADVFDLVQDASETRKPGMATGKRLCPNCKEEIIDDNYLDFYGHICQKCGYDFLC